VGAGPGRVDGRATPQAGLPFLSVSKIPWLKAAPEKVGGRCRSSSAGFLVLGKRLVAKLVEFRLRREGTVLRSF